MSARLPRRHPARAAAKRHPGLYVLALCSGLGAISTIKLAMTDADECGIDQTGLYIWTAVVAAVGYYSYQNSL